MTDGINSVFDTAWSFDGHNLFALKANKEKPCVLMDGNQKITITYAKSIKTDDFSSREVHMVVNTLVRKLMRNMDLIQFGRKFFHNEPYNVRGFNLLLYKGFSASVNPTLNGYQLVVDLSHRVMRAESVRDVMNNIRQRIYDEMTHLDDSQQWEEYVARCNEALAGTVVMAKYNRRIWRINRVDFDKSLSSTFTKKDGTTISFGEYYREMYEMEVDSAAASIPGLLVYEPKNARSSRTTTYLIPDFCYITGISDDMRANNKLMQSISQHTRLPPHKRVSDVGKLVSDILGTEKVKSIMDKMPLRLSSHATKARARLIGPFKLELGAKDRDGRRVKVMMDAEKKRRGFEKDVRSSGFFLSKDQKPTLVRWALIGEERDERLLNQIEDTLAQLGRQQGANVHPPKYFVHRSGRGQDKIEGWRHSLEEATNPEKRMQFMVCLIPRGDAEIYSFVKHTCSIANGVVSQCFSTATLANQKMRRPVIGNGFKQIMHKLGWRSWKIKYHKTMDHKFLSKEPTMLVGVDLCHDRKIANSFNSTRGPKQSCVGFCATVDSDYSYYNSWVAFQRGDAECITTAFDLMKNAVEAFYKTNRTYPKNVIVYRDGVGDSQLNTFVKQEIEDYKKAFQSVGQHEIKITVIVVQKNVNVRFFHECEKQRDRHAKCKAEGFKCDNARFHSPCPGTVIDRDVCNPLYYDFYLVPTKAPKGACASPTRFVVVRDERKLSADDLQTFTYQLTCSYFNWPGPIRVPSPCMYAHKLSYLFGVYLNGHPNKKLSNQLHYL